MILVAGAGPVGLTMAMSLKRLGVDVRIIDKNAGRTDKSKALVIWPRTLELLEIQGCAQDFMAAGMKASGARMWAGTKELVHVRLERAHSDFKFALMIPQNETERVLEEQLASLGVRVEREVELLSFQQDEQGVSAALRAASGDDTEVRCDYLLGCDGAHSAIRQGLGAQFMGSTLPSDWVLGDFYIDGPLAQDEITICWTEYGVLALFPIIGGRFRLIADMGSAPPTPGPPPTLDELQTILNERGPPGLKAHDPFWLSRFRINERKVKDYSQGRVFLSGDAAHIHSPAGGQGMNTGMQDAFNLAWKIALVAQARAKPALLDSYSPERSAVGDQVLRNAGRLTEIATMSNPILQEIRNVAAGTLGHLSVVQQRIVDMLTETDLHYPDSPLTSSPHGASRRPAGGERAQNVPLVRPDGSAARLHEVLRAGKFVVFCVGVPDVVLPSTLSAMATTARAPESDAYDGGHIYLIRPDAYVAMSTGDDGGAAIVAELERIAG